MAGRVALLMVAALSLAACGGGASEAVNATAITDRPADLDTARPPPQTVTQTPLLPPVDAPPDPAQTRAQPTTNWNTERLYTEDEQAQIGRELTAVARAQRRY